MGRGSSSKECRHAGCTRFVNFNGVFNFISTNSFPSDVLPIVLLRELTTFLTSTICSIVLILFVPAHNIKPLFLDTLLLHEESLRMVLLSIIIPWQVRDDERLHETCHGIWPSDDP